MKANALEILQTLRDHGFTALFAGGCVRDMLMGKEPGDYDIVTDAAPEQVRRLFRRTVPVGAQFGIVIVMLQGVKYEVAQFRNSLPEGPASLPAPASDADRLRKDAGHRDFTINGMFYDPFTDALFDSVGGQRDLERKLIRGIANPEARFAEDQLRMLRAIRFAAAFDYQIEPATWAAICALAPQITQVSAERIRDEVLRILTTPHPDQGLRLLDETGLLAQILPEVAALKGMPQPLEFHPEGDVFTHTCLMLQQMAAASPLQNVDSPPGRDQGGGPGSAERAGLGPHPQPLPGGEFTAWRGKKPYPSGRRAGQKKRKFTPEFAMGVLLHDVGKPATYTHTAGIHFYDHARVGAQMAKELCGRLKFSTNAIAHIVTLVKDHLKFFDVAQMKQSTLKRFLRQEYFSELLELHRLDCLSSNRDLRTYQFCLAKLTEFRQEAVRPPRLISGNDLIRLGLPPGPIFKQVLECVEDAQLEGMVSTRKQALEFVKELQETLTDSAPAQFTSQ